MRPEKYDFKGWATRYNVKCTDGRTLIPGAFKHCDGTTVPVVWGHIHNDPDYVLGNAYLEHRDGEGVYCYVSCNDTRRGQDSKELVKHGDIRWFSIYANKLNQDDKNNVYHGDIKEVSLVLAGANPQAKIDFSLAHSDDIEENCTAAVIFMPDEIMHCDDQEENKEKQKGEDKVDTQKENDKNNEEIIKHEDGKTLEEIFNGMTEEEQEAVLAMIGLAVQQEREEKQNNSNNSEEDKNMKHHAFDNEETARTLKHNDLVAIDKEGKVLSHEDMLDIFETAKRNGSLKEAALAHGVTNVDYLFPDAKLVGAEPATYARDMEWVSAFLNATHKSPFSRIKSAYFNLTAAEARAKGYPVKGEQKLEETIVLLKRTTDPTTVYKLQKFDRDDIVDIKDFNMVSYIKREMQVMLHEELARAALVSDGRSALANDKIKEDNIRPIWKDADTYTIRADVGYSSGDSLTTKLKKFIKACIKARKNYRGTGKPTLWTTEDMLTDLLLMEDVNGRVIYEDEAKLAKALRVSAIQTVPVMENLTRAGTDDDVGYDFDLLGIIVNPYDYTFGLDNMGKETMFDDFDLNFNKLEYLLETRTSGALTTPFSAIAVENKYEHVSQAKVTEVNSK